jgi:hypothetical protein
MPWLPQPTRCLRSNWARLIFCRGNCSGLAASGSVGAPAPRGGRPCALPGALRLGFLALAAGSLGWRWEAVYTGATWASHTWWLDTWHLGPLRLLNFTATAGLISTVLNPLERWQGLLRPLSLIGRHMLPIFCLQIAPEDKEGACGGIFLSLPKALAYSSLDKGVLPSSLEENASWPMTPTRSSTR